VGCVSWIGVAAASGLPTERFCARVGRTVTTCHRYRMRCGAAWMGSCLQGEGFEKV
jgi:hypothetical protein